MMVVCFKENEPEAILQRIREELGDRPLSKIMSFKLQDDQEKLFVTVSKIGTSLLEFECQVLENELRLTLRKEKVAFVHRPLYKEVKAKMVRILNQVGGHVEK